LIQKRLPAKWEPFHFIGADWLRDVRTALEADSIGWTMWDYRVAGIEPVTESTEE
jgi:hypothetical protein